MNTHDDDRTPKLLAQALKDEAALTMPRADGLQKIQQRAASADRAQPARGASAWTSRLGGSDTRRRWWGGALGAGLATTAVITTVVVVGSRGTDNAVSPADEPSQVEPTQAEPTGAEPTATEATGEPTATEPTGETPTGPHEGVYDPDAPADRQVTMYYAGPQGRLYAEPHTLPTAPDDPQLAALQEWWTSTPLDPDLDALVIPNPNLQVVDISQAGHATTIEIEGIEGSDPKFDAFLHFVAEPDGSKAQLSADPLYQALLRTAGVEGEARFTYNGEPVEESNGVRLDPLKAMSDDDVRAWISIESPVEGQAVTSPVTATVSGNVFEGSVNWQLFDEDGTKVDEGVVTTSMGVWARADIKLSTLEPGTYTLRCLEYSAEDGHPMNIDDKTFVVE